MYDYIIVGAGSSGCALAGKLHELCPEATILMIEAGGSNDDPRIHDFTRVSETYKDFAWHDTSSHQINLDNRILSYLSGRTDGGSGSINGMVCVKPHPADVITSYLDQKNIDEACDKLTPIKKFTKNPLSKEFMVSLQKFGFEKIGNYLKKNNEEEGLAYTRLNVSDSGIRLDPYSVFVKKYIDKKEKITIINNATVHKLILDKNLNARGIIIYSNSSEQTFYANHEIILCTGTTHTPVILFNSGIGPTELLKQNNISPLLDLPVGENFHDQLIVYAVRPFKQPIPKDHITSMDMTGFFRYDNFVFEPTFKFVPVDKTRQPDFQLQSFVLKDGWGPDIPPNSFVIGIIQLHSTSRGSITIQKNNDEQATVINPNCVSTDFDVTQLIQAQKIAIGIIDSFSDDLFEKRTLPKEQNPTDKQLLAYIKQIASPDFHPAGSCSFDKVVNKDFTVKSINKLRIADASVIPSPVSGNPQITSCAVGIQAAEIIAQQYQLIYRQQLQSNIAYIKSSTYAKTKQNIEHDETAIEKTPHVSTPHLKFPGVFY